MRVLQKYFTAASLTFILLALLICLLGQIFNHSVFANADALQYQAFSLDLLQHHYPLSGWMFFVTPNFLIVILLYVPFYFLTQNFLLCFLILELIEISLLILLLILINKSIYPSNYKFTILPILIFIDFMLIVYRHDQSLLYDIFSHCHFISFLLSLGILWFIFTFWNKKINWVFKSGIFFFSFFVVISDQLILAMFFAPSLLSAIGCYWKKKQIPLSLFKFLLLGSFSAFVLTRFVHFHQLHVSLSFKDVSVFITTLPLFFKGVNAIYFAIWISCFVGISFLFVSLIRSRSLIKNLDFNSNEDILTFWFFFLFFLPIVLLASALSTGEFEGILSSRYLTAALILPIFGWITFILVYLNLFFGPKFVTVACIFLTSLLLIFFLPNSKVSLWPYWLHQYPAETACLDHINKQLKTKYGLTDYWNSRLINSYSKFNLWTNQINKDGTIDWYLNNKFWYLHEKNNQNLPKYSFVIDDPKKQFDSSQYFGKPDKVFYCKQAGFKIKETILIYNQTKSITQLNRKYLQINSVFFKKLTRNS